MDQISEHRDWESLQQRHVAFWTRGPTDRPLIYIMVDAYVDTELVAAAFGSGELTPDRIDPGPLLPEYDRIARARQRIGDDAIAVAEPLLGIPWLEAMVGCRVLIPDGTSIWPEPPVNVEATDAIVFDSSNPWFRKLIAVLQAVVAHVRDRYAVSLSHLRGPADVLIARFGSERLLTMLFDEPEKVKVLAHQCAELWRQVVTAEMKVVRPYRGGYGVRQFGLWAPQRAVWLQDDTSSMISARHYRRFFLAAMQEMSFLPYGVLHLHIGSLHVARLLSSIPNVRAVNLYFDDPKVSLEKAMPVLQELQRAGMPLILAKTVYEGFSLAEYEEILSGLSPCGLSVHLAASSIEEGKAIMDAVRARANTR